MPSGCGHETIHRRSGDPRPRRQRYAARRDRGRPCRGAARRRAGPPRTGSPDHACPSRPSESGLLSRPRHAGSPPRESTLGRESCAQWTPSSGPNWSGARPATPLPKTTRRCPWPAGPLQPWPLANCLEEFLRGFWHPDQALASFGDHTLVTEEVHCRIQALPGCGVAPLPEGREESIAAHRTPGLLQGGEHVFDRLKCRVGPWLCISWPGGFQDLGHDSYYMHLYSICILSPQARNGSLSFVASSGSWGGYGPEGSREENAASPTATVLSTGSASFLHNLVLRAKRVWDRAEERDSGIRNSVCFSLSQNVIQPGKQVGGRIDGREDHQKSKFECDVTD